MTYKKNSVLIITLLAMILAVACQPAIAEKGSIKLLAAYPSDDGQLKGGTADLELEMTKGTGRVFMETIPLTKTDTQVSTRFAKEIACRFVEEECEGKDFFYTIKADAGMIGGPSAGAAITALTIAMLSGTEIDQAVAMTGTINSGDVIGPVGSLQAKIKAASEQGLTKVLVPYVQTAQLIDNMTIIEYGAGLGIEVVPVSTISEAMLELTGQDFTEEDKNITVPESYREVMKDVAQQLCERTERLMTTIDAADLMGNDLLIENINTYKQAQNLTKKGMDAFEEGNHYSAASYCFGANVQANRLIYNVKNLSEELGQLEAEKLMEDITSFDALTEERKKETITDLQTYMIVKERILEAKQHLVEGSDPENTLSYVEERLNSAKAWSAFFGNGGESYVLDEKSLAESCVQVLGEVDERFQYLNTVFPGLLNNLRNNLLTAHNHHDTGEYGLCIYLARRTKAEADIMVTLLGVSEDFLDEVIDQKMDAAKRAINRQIDKGIFPIIAYSYFEYATSLKEENRYSALLYSEYALELSELDLYFEKQKTRLDVVTLQEKAKRYLPTTMFLWGMLLGLLIGVFATKQTKRYEKKTPVIKIKRTKLRLR